MNDDNQLFSSALYRLDDPSFLSIMRNYLGPIRTPFHKPELISRLTNMITRKENRRRIYSLIDELDSRILSAVYLLKRSDIHSLYQLFSPQIEYYVIQQRIVNLEERLLLLHDQSDDLVINPIFFHDLLGTKIRMDRLIRIVRADSKRTDDSGSRFLFEQPFYIALFSLFASSKVRLTAESLVRRSSLALFENRLGSYASESTSGLFQLMTTNLISMGIVRVEDSVAVLQHQRVDSLIEKMGFSVFLQYLFAQSFADLYPKATIETLRSFLCEFLSMTGDAEPLSKEDFIRLWDVVCSYHDLPFYEGAEPFYILSLLGILRRSDRGYEISGEVRRFLSPSDPEHEVNCFIDPDYSITIDRDLTFQSAPLLYYFIRIRNIDTSYRFELSKESCVQAFDQGLQVEQITGTLRSITSAELPGNIVQTIAGWKREYDSIGIYSGIVVTADEYRRRIIELHPSLSSHVIKVLAPGVYLFDPRTEISWREILASAGCDVLPKTRHFGAQQFPDQPLSFSIESCDLLGRLEEQFFTNGPETDDRASEEILENLYGELEKRNLTRSEREDLEARIEKKLIILPGQLETTYLHPTATQAKGFDYQGKVNLAKAAIASGTDLLEIHLRSALETQQVLLIRPVDLFKEENDLVIRGVRLPEGQQFTKSLRKIFLLKKLKASLYTPL